MSSEARKLWARSGALRHLDGSIRQMIQGRAFAEALPEKYKHRYVVQLQNLKALMRRIETWPVTETERDQLRAAEYSRKIQKQREEARPDG